MIDFENTEIAFAGKSTKELKRARLLFRMVASNLMVKIGKELTEICIDFNIPIKWIIKPTIFRHFCGGETLLKSVPVIEKLAESNVKGVLDYSVEGKENDEDIEAALKETLRAIKWGAKRDTIPFAVFKPTAFTKAVILEKLSAGCELNEEEKEEADKFKNRIDKMCDLASLLGIPILIDAEDYAFQKAIDDVVTEMMMKYNKEKAIVFNTLQMYRHDRLDFLEESIKHAKENKYFYGVKFVRGAYMEKERERAKKLGYPSPIHETKEDTDNAYNNALRYSMENIDIVSIFNGTHNEESCILLCRLIENKGLKKDDPRVYFSQLYGMSDQISFNLAHQGYNVAKYVPYGPVFHVLPYLIRRAEENTSVKGQTGRELSLIQKELKRRNNN